MWQPIHAVNVLSSIIKSNLQMMRVLVTGGAGYIGSHVCKALAVRGFEPIAYDNLSRGNRWAVEWGPLEEGNIGDIKRVRAVLEQYRPIAVMHFAALAYVAESVREPLLYIRNNVCGTTGLLQALVDYGPLPFVLSSTCSTYGIPQTIPISEDHPQNPINPYGFSKLVVERLLADLEPVQGLRSISLRYFNAAGADPEGEIGEAHNPETHLIPLVLKAARDGTPVHVFGTDYDTPDGTCVRDFIHVADIADAHLRALDYLLKGGPSCALNLANARGYSIKDVIAAAENVCDRPIRMEIAPRRDGDPPILIGSPARAESVLGWRPARSSLNTQISDAWNWMMKGRQ
jgi:UDP-arabinose 4-epimerase